MRLPRLLSRLATVLTLAVLTAPPPAGAAGEPGEGVARLELLPGWRRADGSHVAAVSLTLAEGWKTYWRAPGEAGIPPRFTWGGSKNLAAASVEFPAPRVFDQNGLESIGYSGQVIFPLILRPADPGAAIALRGRVELGICEEVCLPASFDFAGALPASGAGRDPRIVAALAARPLRAAEAGVGAVSCTIAPAEDGMAISARIEMPPLAGREHVVIEAGDEALWLSRGAARREGGVLASTAQAWHVDGAGFAIDRSRLRLTVIGARGAVEITGCPAP